MLYTRKGDSGTTGLYGSKERLPKDSVVCEALGSLDELNSLLGVCRATAQRQEAAPYSIAATLRALQQQLFIIQAELAGAKKTIVQSYVDWIEEMTNNLEKQIPNPRAFVIPGSTELSGLLDYARAVARRTERMLVHARGAREMSVATYSYLNRLSSLLYALARYAAALARERESPPTYR